MITLGVDAHKRLHVAVALDANGRELGHWQGPNTREGWTALRAWANEHGTPRHWGIEGAWNYGRGVAQYLVAQAEVVYDVNPRWTAAQRQRARKPGKSDQLDARAVAIFVLREAPSLAPLLADDETAVLDLLVTERDGVLAEATRLRNQLHQMLLQLEPTYGATLRRFRTEADLDALDQYLDYLVGRTEPPETLRSARIAAARRLGDRLRMALQQARELQAQIETRARADFAPLTQLCGVSLLTAGALAGILGPGQRFTSDAQLAALAGVAPLETSSAGGVRHRLNRGGNRRLNAILYRIALTQRRLCPQAQAYLARRLREGKTMREALRALKRFLVRAIWRLWQACCVRTDPAGVAA